MIAGTWPIGRTGGSTRRIVRMVALVTGQDKDQSEGNGGQKQDRAGHNQGPNEARIAPLGIFGGGWGQPCACFAVYRCGRPASTGGGSGGGGGDRHGGIIHLVWSGHGIYETSVGVELEGLTIALMMMILIIVMIIFVVVVFVGGRCVTMLSP